MKISKQRLIETCERFGFGMTVNTNPVEITLGFAVIGSFIEVDEETCELDIRPKYRDLFR